MENLSSTEEKAMFYRPEQIELNQPIILYGRDKSGYKIFEFHGITEAIDFLKTTNDFETSEAPELIVRIRFILRDTNTPLKMIEVKGEKVFVIHELRKYEKRMQTLHLIS